MAKKILKITESRLKELVRESIERKLNEVSYSLAQDTYDKMIYKGQHSRANDLNDTFREINNDENAEYSLAGGTLTLKGDISDYDENNNLQKSSEYYRRNDNGNVAMYARERILDKNGNYNGRDRERVGSPKTKHRITTNPKVARNMAKHMKNFDPDTEMTKDDFRR